MTKVEIIAIFGNICRSVLTFLFVFVELIRILLRDVKEFDKNVWTYAVSVVMGAMVILGLSVCFMLLRDCYEEDERSGENFISFLLVKRLAFQQIRCIRLVCKKLLHS